LAQGEASRTLISYGIMAVPGLDMAALIAQAQAEQMQHLTAMMSLGLMQPAEQSFVLPGQSLIAQPAVQNFGLQPAVQNFFAQQAVQSVAAQPAGQYGTAGGIASLHGVSPQAQSVTQAVPTTLEDGKPGTLQNFGEKGFGYITPDDGSEQVFFHFRAVLNGTEVDMVPGAKLKYEMGLDRPSGRMKAVKVLLDAPGSGSVAATPDEVEQFLALNPVDEGVQAHLRSVDPMVQRMVINRGSLERARDPSAMLSSRISHAFNASSQPGSGYGKAAGEKGAGLMKGGPYGKGGKSGGKAESDTVFVKSLPVESTPDTVQGIFSQYGGVKSVKVLPPSGGRNVVAAFVVMNSLEEAKYVVENVNGQVPMGLQKPVETMFAQSREGKGESAWGKGGFAEGGKGGGMNGMMMGNGMNGMMMGNGMNGMNGMMNFPAASLGAANMNMQPMFW